MDTCSATSSTSSGRPSSSSQTTSKWVDVHPRNCKVPSASQQSYNLAHTMNAKAVECLWSLVLLELLKTVPMLETKYQGKQSSIIMHLLIVRCSLLAPQLLVAADSFEICEENNKLASRRIHKCHGASDHIACARFLQCSMFSCQVSIQGESHCMWHISIPSSSSFFFFFLLLCVI